MLDACFSQPRRVGVEVGNFQDHGAVPGSFRFAVHLQAKARAQLPLEQTGHGPTIRTPANQLRIPVLGAGQIRYRGISEHSREHLPRLSRRLESAFMITFDYHGARESRANPVKPAN
ncbi:hypothetical protein [Glutamicibacter arilaitensis]|uniref:hypothetical protein n=1 Tax=Glutamicibacter arilaitensis TaxID=256701 RepID=UPI003F9138C1